MRTRTINLMGYGPVIRNKRAVYAAANLLEVHQEKVKAEKQGNPPPTEWTYRTETGRRLLGLEVGEFFRSSDLIPAPLGLVKCPRCLGNGCRICNWSGETTRRVLDRNAPEPKKKTTGRE